jgi:hypothetical protein
MATTGKRYDRGAAGADGQRAGVSVQWAGASNWAAGCTVQCYDGLVPRGGAGTDGE